MGSVLCALDYSFVAFSLVSLLKRCYCCAVYIYSVVSLSQAIFCGFGCCFLGCDKSKRLRSLPSDKLFLLASVVRVVDLLSPFVLLSPW